MEMPEKSCESFDCYSSDDEQELLRSQLSWAEQVDLVYPLEECWSESCLTDPHACMDDHPVPEVAPGVVDLDHPHPRCHCNNVDFSCPSTAGPEWPSVTQKMPPQEQDLVKLDQPRFTWPSMVGPEWLIGTEKMDLKVVGLEQARFRWNTSGFNFLPRNVNDLFPKDNVGGYSYVYSKVPPVPKDASGGVKVVGLDQPHCRCNNVKFGFPRNAEPEWPSVTQKMPPQEQDLVKLDQPCFTWHTGDFTWPSMVGEEWLRGTEKMEQKVVGPEQARFHWNPSRFNFLPRNVRDLYPKDNVGGYSYVYSTVPP